ncbi:nucleotidyl transferase AbiEii/AbiGii toxin family protein [Taylorella asinigenitalis]|uniref:Uncharacterized protein n=1 Tax=Taylorella asinigenitalis (strain MCE3) TaxID=1008459 RepID=G4Q9Y2_TAYAM|nr:nucleotidyl transferase AbiEii/AbiGii toxin family protein [Taylorella asinigenitalis]AEP36901.1 hypothetical protein TASI_1147 [Taylorella asinigenitalis MCE3]
MIVTIYICVYLKVEQNILNSENKETFQYISGWEALNITNEKGLTADWHPLNYFQKDKPFKLYTLDKCMPLGTKGIKLRYIPFLKNRYYVASFARAIADLVYLDQCYGLKNCVYDFLDEKDAKEIYDYLKIINKTKNVEQFMRYELTKLYFEEKTMLDSQNDRIKLIKEILPLLGDKFVLKGGTALYLYYGLDRYSEDVDLDCKTSNMNFLNKLKNHRDFKDWKVTLKTNTETAFKLMIDYGAVSKEGAYPLKIEVSARNTQRLRDLPNLYQKHGNVNVYGIDELIHMKTAAFTGRDKVRDLYDLNFLFKKYPENFSESLLRVIVPKLYYSGEEELNNLLEYEFNKHNLSISGFVDFKNFTESLEKRMTERLTFLEKNKTIYPTNSKHDNDG